MMNDREILQSVRTFYAEVVKQYAAAGYYARLPLNKFWEEQNMPVMRDIIETSDSPTAVVHRAQQTFMFSVNVQTPVKNRAIDWLLEEQRSRGIDLLALPPEVQESEFSFPGNNVDRRGRRLTSDFVRTVNIALAIAKFFLPSENPRLRPHKTKLAAVELGGGLGHLARTMRLLGLTRSHVIIDLPETLVFSYCFLSLNFPEARLVLVQDEHSARRLATQDYDFAFVPALLADKVLGPSYDLFVNTASLGEMRNEVVRHWMDFVQNRLDVRALYTLNRYLNTVHPARHVFRWEENECSVHYDRRWELLQWELEPPFTRCPFVDTLIARYVEIAAVRLSAVDAEACMRTSKALLEQVREEDWYRFRGEDETMTLGDHILAHDLTRSGTLFKLWNALRLDPTIDAVATLLVYLDTLLARDDRQFEEQRYYEDLFLRLHDPQRHAALAELADRINRRRASWARRAAPKLIEAHHAFNFIQAGDRFLAVSLSLGAFDPFNDRVGERDLPPVLLTGSSLDEVRQKVVELVRRKAIDRPVRLRSLNPLTLLKYFAKRLLGPRRYERLYSMLRHVGLI